MISRERKHDEKAVVSFQQEPVSSLPFQPHSKFSATIISRDVSSCTPGVDTSSVVMNYHALDGNGVVLHTLRTNSEAEGCFA